MKLYIGSDHRGFELKEKLKLFFSLKTPAVILNDVGCYDLNPADYPEIVSLLESKMTKNDAAVLICGSGIGMAIAANRFKGLRAAWCHNKVMAGLARRHNDANVIVFGADFIETDEAIEALEVFIKTDFEGGRHARRIKMIDERQNG